MHVVDPGAFPLAAEAQYTPTAHTIADARAALAPLGIANMVIVQPSIYSTDNACTLAGLRDLGPRAGRAVIQFDPADTPPARLREWHELGVRGVRVNLKSVGARVEGASLTATLRAYAAVIRPLGWVLEVYIGLEDMALLAGAVSEVLGDGGGDGVKLCIDHFGHPSAASLATAPSLAGLPGFAALAQLLSARDDVWVKCSATYRLDRDARHPLVGALRREVLRLRPDRCVFATDWPHTRMEDVDLVPHLEALFDCCDELGVPLRRVCVDNAEELFDAKA